MIGDKRPSTAVSGFLPKAPIYWWPGVITLSCLLRVLAIQRDALWVDEAISYLTATMPLPLILNNTVQSSHPPLYYLLLHYWLPLWPDHDLFLRLFSLFWGILLLPALYWLTMEIIENRRLAFLAVLFAAVSPFYLLYSNELRMYTQQLFLITLAAAAYLKARETDLWRWWLLFGGAALAALYTHLFTVFFLLGVGVHALILQQDRRALWWTVGIGAGLFVLFLPWVFVLLAETQAELGSMRPLATDATLVDFNPVKPLTTLSFLLFGLSLSTVYAGMALFLSLALTVMTVLELLKTRRNGGTDRTLLFPIVVVVAVIGLPHVIYFLRPFFLPERTMAAALPFLIVLISWGVTRRKTPLMVLSYIALTVMAWGSLLYLRSEPLKTPYHELMAFVVENWHPDDIVVHTSDFSYMPALRYAQLPRHVLLQGAPGAPKPEVAHQVVGGDQWRIEEVEQASGRIWLIVALVDNLEWQQEQADYFVANYTQLQRQNVGGVEVFLFQISP
jgi:uncharacterized membrane protein